MKRRDLLKNVTSLSGLAFLAPMLSSVFFTKSANADEHRGGATSSAELEMLNPKDGIASSLGYVENSKDSAKAGEKKCETCRLFSKPHKKNDKDVGTCTLFEKKLVFSNAYCNSWVKP